MKGAASGAVRVTRRLYRGRFEWTGDFSDDGLLVITGGRSSNDPDADYNVVQSKMTIGSGGFSGKGYLQGTLTQLDYVVEGSVVYPPHYPYRSGITKELETYQRAFADGRVRGRSFVAARLA